MKKIITLITALLIIVCAPLAFAEEVGEKNANTASGFVSDELTLGKIKELFPDKALAKFVRDALGKISIEQTVTQAELDTITWLSISSDKDYGDFSDLTGIGYLRNLKNFCLYSSMEYLGTEFPEEFYTLTKLQDLSVPGQKITALSESIGNLTNLVYLIVRDTEITTLPESIGNLTKLEYLDVSNTEIASLPESIGNLTKLYNLNISYTNIKELPDSIWNLKLDTLGMKGLPIE